MPRHFAVLQRHDSVVHFAHLIGQRRQQLLEYLHTRQRSFVCLGTIVGRRLSLDLHAQLRLVTNELTVSEFKPTLWYPPGDVVTQFAKPMVVQLPDEAACLGGNEE